MSTQSDLGIKHLLEIGGQNSVVFHRTPDLNLFFLHWGCFYLYLGNVPHLSMSYTPEVKDNILKMRKIPSQTNFTIISLFSKITSILVFVTTTFLDFPLH